MKNGDKDLRPNGRLVQAWTQLQAGKQPEGLGLPLHHGRVDLRGLALPPVESTPTGSGKLRFRAASAPLPEIRGRQIRGVDLTGAAIPHLRLFDTGFSDVTFRDARLTDLRAWRTTFEGCDLSGADLRESVLGAWDGGSGNAWHACRFDDAQLDGVVCVGTSFVGCTFSRVALRDLAFQGCSFIDCTFTGSLDNVVFSAKGAPEGAPLAVMAGVDFSNCSFSDVSFTGLQLAGVDLPNTRNIRVISSGKDILEWVAARLPSSGPGSSLRFWVNYQIGQSTGASDIYLDIEDLQVSMGDSANLLLGLIGDASIALGVFERGGGGDKRHD